MTCLRRLAIVLVVLFLATAAPTPQPTAAADGGAHFFGSMGGRQLNAPVVGMTRSRAGDGYRLVASDGGIFSFGNAPFHGSMGGHPLNAPIVGMAPDDRTGGYWMVASDGGIFAFGGAPFHGSMGGRPLNAPIVGMAATPSGDGYWLVASDGGIFAFGNARFFGSMGGQRLNAPIMAMAATPTGDGYWFAARDGGVFVFGGAAFRGSMGGQRLNQPVVSMAAAPNGGYWLVASDGGIFAFGGAPFHGSTGGTPLNAPVVGMAATPSGGGYWLVASDGGIFGFPTGAPTLHASVVASGLTIPWDIGFTPDGTLLYTERPGRIGAVVGGSTRVLRTVTDALVNSEGGVLGMAVDPDFAANRRIYVCQTFNGSTDDVRLWAYTVDAGYTTATRVGGPLFSGAPVTTGQHSGCRPRVGPDGYLWVGTGDAVTGTTPQNLSSLGGKVLRLDRFTGAAAGGNHAGLVYTYGHRNVQGLAFRPGSGQAFAVEHGPDRDDEITLLRAGGNGGWDPTPGSYNQSVPMTDLGRFPNAMRPTWASGSPTIAASGATFVQGSNWKSWSGALLVAALKGTHIRAFFLDAAGNLTGQQVAFDGPDRLRSPVLGPDGSLYVTTSNGSNDRILKLTPG